MTDNAMTKQRVTRMEIADCIGDAFVPGGADRVGLIEHAVALDARPELLATLERLPDRTYPVLRELWRDLADIPVE